MTLDLGKCVLCDRAFVYKVGEKQVCHECSVRLDELYGKVRSLLRDYADRRLSVSHVAEILKVSEREINYLIEEGRFQRVDVWQLTEDRDFDLRKRF